LLQVTERELVIFGDDAGKLGNLTPELLSVGKDNAEV
jgi:hypothetical protein